VLNSNAQSHHHIQRENNRRVLEIHRNKRPLGAVLENKDGKDISEKIVKELVFSERCTHAR
jgi:hypothetical protein